jgi:hypothetical protein
VPAVEVPEDQRMPTILSIILVVDSGLIRSQVGYGELGAYEAGLRRTVEWERVYTESQP